MPKREVVNIDENDNYDFVPIEEITGNNFFTFKPSYDFKPVVVPTEYQPYLKRVEGE